MGKIRTDYYLDIKGDNERIYKAIKRMRQAFLDQGTFTAFGMDFLMTSLFDMRAQEIVQGHFHLAGTGGENWNGANADMLQLSAEFPDLLFSLTKERRELNVFERTYYMGGKRQFAKGVLTYEEFDPDKLS